MKGKNPVVVTGVGAMTALGNSAAETWNALLAGKNGIRTLEGFDVEGFDCRLGAQIRGFESLTMGFDSKLTRVLDLHSFMLLKCAQDAFTSAGLDTAGIVPEDIGIFVGMGMVDYKISDLLPAVVDSLDANGALDMDLFYSRGYRQIYPLITLAMLNNVSLCEVAIRLNIRGENIVFSPYADAGAQAIAEGMNALAEKRAEVALVGGVSEKISPLRLARAHLWNRLNVSGSGYMPCRPFAAERNGTVLGEGCGVLSLELREAAERRGAPYAVALTGYGCSFDLDEGRGTPTTAGMIRAMQEALASAEVDAADVDVVIAHADGALAGDANEIDAIHQVFAACLDRALVFSSKGFLGHLLAGAVGVDLIVAAYIIAEQVVPPTLCEVPTDSGIKFHLVRDRPFECAPRRVLLNCRSDEGHCASLIVEAVS